MLSRRVDIIGRVQPDASKILNAIGGVAYLTSPDGAIISIGRKNWLDFALANDGAAIADASKLIGANIFDFISGEDVVSAYRRYFDILLTGRAPEIRFPYRCDSPSVMRKMRMSMTPIVWGDAIEAVLFQSLVIDELTRPPLNIFDYEATLAGFKERNTLPIIKLCSYCHDIKDDAGASGWISAEAYYGAGGSSAVRISHGICPACEKRWVSDYPVRDVSV